MSNSQLYLLYGFPSPILHLVDLLFGVIVEAAFGTQEIGEECFADCACASGNCVATVDPEGNQLNDRSNPTIGGGCKQTGTY